MKQHEYLRKYNEWRRGGDWSADDHRGPDPKELGELIDDVADRLEALRTLLHDIKAWDVSKLLQIPHELRARIQNESEK